MRLLYTAHVTKDGILFDVYQYCLSTHTSTCIERTATKKWKYLSEYCCRFMIISRKQKNNKTSVVMQKRWFYQLSLVRRWLRGREAYFNVLCQIQELPNRTKLTLLKDLLTLPVVSKSYPNIINLMAGSHINP